MFVYILKQYRVVIKNATISDDFSSKIGFSTRPLTTLPGSPDRRNLNRKTGTPIAFPENLYRGLA